MFSAANIKPQPFVVKLPGMQSLQDLSKEINLTSDQQQAVQNYISLLIVELLQTLKQDTVANFDETIDAFQSK